MAAKIKHLAIVSDKGDALARFYETLFGMKRDTTREPTGAAVVSDGYVGLNVNPRVPGRQGGFDHFGVEVDDVEEVFDRLRTKYPSVEVLKRPGNRPFAGISTHDPAGNVFDLSQAGMENRRGLYVEEFADQPRRVDHFMVRAVRAQEVAEFYVNVFDLMELEKPPSDPNHYLSDGRVTLVVAPWKISDYAGGGIERPAPDHIGFKVESVEAVQHDLVTMVERSPELAPKPWKAGPEGEARLNLFAACSNSAFQLCDPDGVLVDVTERAYM